MSIWINGLKVCILKNKWFQNEKKKKKNENMIFLKRSWAFAKICENLMFLLIQRLANISKKDKDLLFFFF